MKDSKTYRVMVEMDVTALDKEEAIKFMVDDVVECFKDGRLDPVVTDLSKELNTRNFATQKRMVEIANAAIDNFGELLNGRDLYDCLAGSLKMNDDEILAAGFTTLKEFMESKEHEDDE